MKGIWSVYSPPISPGLGEPSLSVTWLVLVFLLTSWIISLESRCKSWATAIDGCDYGLSILVVWYVAHSVDLWLHAEGVSLPYGYVLTEPIFESVRIVSNVVVLRGTALLVLQDLRARCDRWEVTLGRVVAGLALVLLILGFYFIGLYLALAFVWTFFADASAIEDIARRRNEFETAFAAFQFIYALALVGCYGRSTYTRLRYDRHMTTQAWLLAGLTLSLFARSFSELIIIGGRNRDSGPLMSQTTQAREVTFGLFTVFYAGFVWWFAQTVSRSDTAVAGSESEKEETRRWILTYLDNRTEKCRVSAPPFSAVTQSYRNHLVGQADADAKRSYMADLEARFAGNVR